MNHHLSSEAIAALPPRADGAIPWHVRVVYHGRDENDIGEHLVEFNVVGMDGPAAVVIQSEMYTKPVIKERRQRGGLDLPDRLMDDLAIKSFRIVTSSII